MKAINLWPPFLGAGIRLKTLSKDFKFARVEMNLTKLNTNYVGVHFGGSLYSMTDPWYMLMIMEILGPEYLVWDKAASIRFKKPGRGLVFAEFMIEDQLIAEIKDEVAQNGKTEKTIPVNVLDLKGVVVASIEKTIWISLKNK
jgi:hypothetical protein